MKHSKISNIAKIFESTTQFKVRRSSEFFLDGLLVLGFNFINSFNENFLFQLIWAHIFRVFAPIWWKLTIVVGGGGWSAANWITVEPLIIFETHHINYNTVWHLSLSSFFLSVHLFILDVIVLLSFCVCVDTL